MKRSISISLVVILIFITAGGVLSPTQAQPVSDGGFTVDYESAQKVYNGHTFQIIHTPDGEWNDVAAYAKAKGGYLASLTEGSEDAFAYYFMQENGFDSMYFGFSDQISEGVWMWESGEETSYTNWNSGEPNNQGANEHYAMYYKGSVGWNDGSGVGECAYLIEWDAYTEDEALPSVAQIQSEFYRQLQTIDLTKKEGIQLAVDESLPEDIKKNQMILPTGDIFYVPDLASNLCVDEETGISYINNEVMVITSSDLSRETAQMLAMKAGGKIAGDISQTSNILQMVIPQTDLQSIEEICLKLMENDDVLFASYDFGIPVEDNKVELSKDRSKKGWSGTDEDQLWEDEDEDNPADYNWWAEAIRAYSGWEKLDKIPGFQPASMAILEPGIGCNHPDLPENSTYQLPSSAGWHPTMVLGCLEALDNDIGIRGTAAVKDSPSADSWSFWYDSPSCMLVTSIFLAQNTMILDAGVKVINNSWGYHSSDYTALDVIRETLAMNQCGLLTAFILGRELSGHGDFLLVQSAGNEANQSYWNSGWAAITPWTASMNTIVESTLTEYSGLVGLGVYTYYAYKIAKEHIVIVSGCKNEYKDGAYTYWESSGYGNYVDICAPGKDIMTTSAGDGYKYQEVSGTSFSAPMVTGVIADIWGINSSLSAAEVKEILINKSELKARLIKDGKTYETPMLDMKSAIEAALETEGALKIVDEAPEDESKVDSNSVDEGESKKTDDETANVLSLISGLTLTASSLSWEETMVVGADGSFTGYYSNDNLGNYNGQIMTERWCSSYRGKFTVKEKIDDYTYLLTVSDFSYDYEPGTEEVRDDTHYIYTDTNLIGKEMYLYLPGHNLTEVPELFTSLINGKFSDNELLCFAIFHTDLASAMGVFTSGQTAPEIRIADPAETETAPEIQIDVPPIAEDVIDYANILQQLQGLWMKDGGFFDYWYIEGETITAFTPVNPDGALLERTYNKSEPESFTIKPLSPAEGSGYKIIREGGNEYWLIDGFPDSLNCQWYDENGELHYSGTGSLHRVEGYTADDLIVDSESGTDSTQSTDHVSANDVSAYADVVRAYEAEYGKLEFHDTLLASKWYTGVFLVKFIDFDQDGMEEMLIGYSTQFIDPQIGPQQMASPDADVWTLENGKPVLVLEKTRILTGSINSLIQYVKLDGTYYIMTGYIGYAPHFELQAFENGSFYKVYEVQEEASGEDYQWLINGEAVSEKKGVEAYNLIFDHAVQYSGLTNENDGQTESKIRSDLNEAYQRLGINGDNSESAGWQKANGKWYYIGTDGSVTRGWQKVDDKWYYMDSDGVMTTGWQKVDGEWYYLGDDGVMTTGWQEINGKHYYLGDNGVMVTGTQIMNGKTYIFDDSGVWVE